MNKNLAIFLLFCLLAASASFGQNKTTIGTLTGKVIDRTSSKILPFAHLYNINSGKGTVSDENGNFNLEYVNLDDKIISSYIGYNTDTFLVKSVIKTAVISLTPRSEVISAFDVIADNEILYSLIAKSRKNYDPNPGIARTYFQLSTEIKNEEVEFIEGYYNARILGYDILEMSLKNGRLAVQKKDNRYFVSTESSRIFTMSHTIGSNDYFPRSPLQVSKRKLKKYFELRLIKRYLNDIGHKVYLISFQPKIESTKSFSGKIWLDSTSMLVNKMELSIQDAAIHPFVAIWPDDQLETVDMNITRSFDINDNDVRLNHIDFHYSLNYIGRDNEKFQIKSKALLYAFDYSSEYMTPYFEHSNTKHGDYSKISSLPYNTFFWNNCIDFSLPRNNEKQIVFNDSINSLNSRLLFTRNTIIERGFFEHPYKIWNGSRITFKSNDEVKPKLAASSYNLEVQIYLDVNETDEEVNVLSAAIFDPFQSYYESEITDKTICFINMYFDLMEIKRRELVAEIAQKQLSPDEIMVFYADKMREINRFSETFYNEVKKGNDEMKMKKWNEIIKKELNIDNIALFNPFQNG